MISFRAALALVIGVGVLGAAGLLWRGWGDVSDLVDATTDTQALCSALDDDARADLIGRPTPVRLTNVEGSLDPYTCRWATRDHATVPAFVQVVSAPADAWAAELKTTIGSVSTPPGVERRLSALAEAVGRPVTDATEGCELATRVFEISGAPRGARRLVAVTTSSTGAPMVMAQSCVDGTYSAVMVADPALRLDRTLERRTARALRTVERRLS